MSSLPGDSLQDTSQDPSFVQRLFQYQQTKRLHLLIDQILWSFDLGVEQNCSEPFQPYLRAMMCEVKEHLGILLTRPPAESA